MRSLCCSSCSNLCLFGRLSRVSYRPNIQKYCYFIQSHRDIRIDIAADVDISY